MVDTTTRTTIRTTTRTTTRTVTLRPLERRLLWWRDQGVGYEELSGRFRRSPEFLARVERYARYKLANDAGL